MNIRYLTISIIQTFLLLIRKKKYDFILYSPCYFVIENKHIHYQSLINFFRKKNISYLYIEEPYKTNSKRSFNAYYFDFFYFIIVLLRKLVDEKDYIKKDKKIAEIIKPFFLRLQYKNFITISQSMVNFFSEINKSSNIFDLQHGIIYSDKRSYLLNGKVSRNIYENNVKVLLFSKLFQNILIKNEVGNYYKENSIVLGKKITKNKLINKLNNNVLVSLQFTGSHSFKTNQLIFNSIFRTIKKYKKFTFYILEHPRKNNFSISELLLLNNVKLLNRKIHSINQLCSFHFTCYSTMSMDLACYGIPTVFTKTNFSKKFVKEFNYPFNLDFHEIFNDYNTISDKVFLWSKQFYSKESYDLLISYK